MSNGAAMARAPPVDAYGASSLLPRRPHTASPATTTSNVPPRRLGSSQGFDPQRGMKLARTPDESRTHSSSKSNDKGKQPIRGDILVDGAAHLGREHYVPTAYTYSDRNRPRSATTDGNVNGRSRFRGSILVAASDALGFKFGRRRPSIRQPPMPIILPDVIEISAPRMDEEVEERNRLREMAAQAIGLGPFMVSPDTHSRDDSATTDEDEEDQRLILNAAEIRRLGYARNSESTPNIHARSPHSSSVSVTQQLPQPPPTPGARLRSGSMLNHSPPNSTTIAPIPPFPCTISSLSAFQQCGGGYLKYYPPSSLRIFALSKNWKQRHLILSSPATLVTRGQGPAVSYLHLFKSNNSDDRELERLEINEDSVVFVAEEEVGGKRQVIKVGGADVGAMKKEYLHEEGGHSMWLLQITNQAEAQKWITSIKHAILGQRTVRAGLIPAHTLGNNEPRGDMDVMLSIRAQGQSFVPPPSSPTRTTSPVTPINNFTFGETSSNYPASISSHSVRSSVTVPKPSSPTGGAVSALKGLFNASRPRSASRAASIESERQQDRDRDGEGSFASIGSNLLSMLRSSTPDSQSINTIPGSSAPRMNLPFAGPVGPIDRRIDRKILSDRQPVQWANAERTSTEAATVNRANRAFSLGALPLQPPPRKRWTSVGPTTPTASVVEREEEPAPKPARLSFSRVSTDISRESTDSRPETEPPASPSHSSAFQFGTPEQRPRAPSLQSVSTYASGENGISFERSSSSTKRSSGTRSGRRWSRQGVLPNRLTPPSEPPPAAPTWQLGAHPFAAEGDPSHRSSLESRKSVVNALPPFSKRFSGSESVHSNGSASTQSHNLPPTNGSSHNIGPITIRAPSSHRVSVVPPPRPAPTSALPPAPTETNHDDATPEEEEEINQDVLKPMETIPGTSKASFRNSVAQRTFRLSMIAPKPPPSTTLPPRPDEPEYTTATTTTTRSHRRSSSGSAPAHSTKLESIPASPVHTPKATNPFPPPAGPLPPPPPPPSIPLPPTPPTSISPQPQQNPKRTTSLKQRLRILSTPSSSNSGNSHALSRPQLTRASMSASSFTAAQMAAAKAASPPSTPIAEKITLYQNDPSFLQMHTPILPPLPAPQALLPQAAAQVHDSGVAEVTSLSPPPRRGSKQLLDTDFEALKNPTVLSEEKSSIFEEPRRFSLSSPGSPVTPKSQHSELLLEGDFDRAGSTHSPDELSQSPYEKLASPEGSRHYISTSRPASVISLGIMSM